MTAIARPLLSLIILAVSGSPVLLSWGDAL